MKNEQENALIWTTVKRWLELVPQRSAVSELLEAPTNLHPAAVVQTDRAAKRDALTPRAQETKPCADMGHTRRRVREWRRRALFRKGARLQSTTSWTDDFVSLAMLDEDGIVISSYAPEPQEANPHSPINQHVSYLYTREDVAMGLPVRDLCSATMHGTCIETGWRIGIDGRKFWATTTIRSVLLRDGRLQGFSHVMHRTPAPWRSAASVKLSSSNRHSPARAGDQPRSWLARCRDALAIRHVLTAFMVVFATWGVGSNAVGANSSGALPENSIASLHGTAWECAHGFRRVNETCARVELPANAYLDASGNRWRCNRGYLGVNGKCAFIALPANAYLDDAYGTGWRCERAFRESKGACVRIEVPANAHEIDSSYGQGWTCNYGYTLNAGSCERVQIPPNAFLVRSGEEWRCDRGYFAAGGTCSAIEVPQHAHLDMRGNDWVCDRGYRKSDTKCEAIDIPPNAHLNYAGDQWRCNRGFSTRSGGCRPD